MALVQESCPQNRAVANCIFPCLTFISQCSGAVVLGPLGDLFGLHIAFATGAAVLQADLPLVFMSPPKGEGHSSPTSQPDDMLV